MTRDKLLVIAVYHTMTKDGLVFRSQWNFLTSGTVKVAAGIRARYMYHDTGTTNHKKVSNSNDI